MAEEDKRLQTTRSEMLQQQQKQQPKKIKATQEQISTIVLEVELAKQINPPLTQQQRVVLVKELYNYSFTVEELTLRGRSVMVKPTYGTIAIEHWINDHVMSLPDAQKYATDMMWAEIERRRAQFQTIKCANIHEIAEAGLMDMKTYARTIWNEKREEIGRDLEARRLKTEKYLRSADEKTKADLYQKLLYKTKEKYDQLMIQYLYIRAADLIEEVEELL